MRVYLGSDHAGFELKALLIERLAELGHEPIDCGPWTLDPADDYPPYILATASSVVANEDTLGVVIGGSGNGEAIAANKVKGVRAAVAFSDDTAKLGREHNNANVISLGARMYPEADAIRWVEIFVTTQFSEDPRHVRRLDELAEFEASGELPPRPGLGA